MPRTRFVIVPNLALDELVLHYADVASALRLYFSPAAPDFAARYTGRTQKYVSDMLALRLDESDIRSTMALLTRIEATFRVDFDCRCRKRLKDKLSQHFCDLKRTSKNYVRLEDILDGWKIHALQTPALIGELRGAFKFRHWVAHGRYWNPKLGRKYDFDFVYSVISAILSSFPFES
jgi:hypothetical protein